MGIFDARPPLKIGMLVAAFFVISFLGVDEAKAATTCATSGTDVTIAANCQFDAGTYTFSGTLTINAGVTVTAASNAGFAQVILVSDSIDVEGALNGTGYGYGGRAGLGTVSGNGRAGAGHGGNGGINTSYAPIGGQVYGSVTDPTLLGSGGQDTLNSTTGGSGGAAIKLSATGTVTINGSVAVDGTSGANATGGGSGGSVRIDAGTLVGSGTVTANGGADNNNGGGGAGGRIAVYYTTDSSTLISGNKLNAFGGQSLGAASTYGGAGTVYLFRTGVSTNGDLLVDGNNISTLTNTTQATTTPSQTYDNITVKRRAKYVIPSGDTLVTTGTLTGAANNGTVTIDSGGTLDASSTVFTIGNVNVTNNGTLGVVTDLSLSGGTYTHGGTFGAGSLTSLTVHSGGVFQLATTGGISIPTVTVNAYGTMTHYVNTTSKVYYLNVSSTTFTVNANGAVSSTFKGYIGKNGPGAVVGSTRAGASYGGNGGINTTYGPTAGNTYGSATAPADLGSGGSSANNDTTGGYGGGAIKLSVSGTLTVGGSIVSDGSVGGNATGGGAGGSVWIEAGTLAGSGTVTSNGGSDNNNGGGGAGGRVAVYYTTDSSTLISGNNIHAYGGIGTGAGSTYGGAGTVYLFHTGASTNGDLLVDGNNPARIANTTQATSTASQAYDNITVKNAAKYVVPNGDTLTLAASGSLTGGGTVKPSISVNSGGTFDPGSASFTFNNLNVFNDGVLGTVTGLTMTSSTVVHGTTGSFGATLASLTIGTSSLFVASSTTSISLSSLTVNSGGTFNQSTLGGFDMTAVTVNSGGTMTHGDNWNTRQYHLSVTSTTFTVNSGGTVTADSLGWDPYFGPGYGGSSPGPGYGGNGADYGAQTGGATYGSVTAPTDFGSGSAWTSGGGAIKLAVSGTLTVDGTIESDGGNSGVSGAGGSVWLTAGTLAGAGTITTNGGAATSYDAGGGGRIAVYYTTDSSTLISGNKIHAYGGDGSGFYNDGGAGTVFMKAASATNGNLLVDNNSLAYAFSSKTAQATTTPSLTFDNVTVTNRAYYVVTSTTAISIANNLVVATSTATFEIGHTATTTVGNALIVGSGGILTHTSSTAALKISAGYAYVASGGKILASGTGNASTSGTGEGTDAAIPGGAGYGGAGGTGLSGGGAGGSAYGSETAPMDLGSGGGDDTDAGGQQGGAGGGLIYLVSSGSITNDGTIAANGNTGTANDGGGGSGGTVHLVAGTVWAGSGTVTANGAASFSVNGGCGAGGRIATRYASKTYSGTPTATGACAGTGVRAAADGTVYDAAADNPTPVTTSISPTSVVAGSGDTTITVNGSSFIASSVVRLNGAALSTSYVNSGQLTATIPSASLATASSTEYVTVYTTTPGGGVSNAQTLTVTNPVPVTSSVSPTSATAGAGDTSVTVSGTGFYSGSVVRWNGASLVTVFSSSSSISATIPSADLAVATSTAYITVFNTTPGGGTSNAQTFTVNNPGPSISSLSPSSKTAGDAGFTLIVNGTGFVSGSVVNWGGTALSTTYVSAIQVTAVVPSSNVSSAGSFNVTVTNPAPGGGISTASSFTVNAASSGGSSYSGTYETINGVNVLRTVGPVISAVGSKDVTTNSATVYWTTQRSSDSTVRYGVTAGYAAEKADTASVTSHSTQLVNLSPGTTYHFQVCSTDGTQTRECSSDMTFTTAASGTTTPTVPTVPTDTGTAPAGEAPGATGSYGANEALGGSASIDSDRGFTAPTGGASPSCAPGDLVKLPNDNDPATQFDSAVYYCGLDSKRHAFPNLGTFLSWYSDFGGVKVISKEAMASLPLGANVTYRPGPKMVKITSDRRIYAVAKGAILRHVVSEQVAKALYGDSWNSFVEDVSEIFFMDYTIGDPIEIKDVLTVYVDPKPTIASETVAPLPAPQASCKTATTFSSFLSEGSSGPEVKALQTLLQCLGDFPKDTDPTGIYGPTTVSAVRSFQAAHGIDPLGHVGPATREALGAYR